MVAVITIYILTRYVNADINGLFKKLKRLWQVILFATIAQSFFVKEGTVLLAIFQVTVFTSEGIYQGGIIFLRFFTLICGACCIGQVNREEVVQGMVWFKIPYELAFTAVLGLGFLPRFRTEMRNSLYAIQLRGIEIKELKLKNKIKLYSYLFFPVISTSLLKARDLSASMQVRGFRAYDRRTDMIEMRVQKKDVVIALSIILVQSATITGGILL